MQVLFDAVFARDIPRVRALLRQVVGDAEVLEPLSALRAAIDSDLPEIVEVYREEGFDLNRPDMTGWAPLISAASGGRTAIVKQLLATGVCAVDAPDADNMTALLHAAYGQHLEIVKILVGAGADVSHRNSEGHTALHLARLRKFSVPAIPIIGPGFGVYRSLIDSPVARYLRCLAVPQ